MLPVMIGMMVAGGVMNAVASRKAGKEAAREIERAGEATARAYETAAAETLQVGEEDVFIARIKGETVLGAAVAAQGQSGLTGGEGALVQTSIFTGMDVAAIKRTARRGAWNLIDQADETRRAARAAARAAIKGGKTAALSSLLGTGAQVAAMYAGRGGGGGGGATSGGTGRGVGAPSLIE